MENARKKPSFWELVEDQNFATRKLVLILEEDLKDIFDDMADKLWDVNNLLEDLKGISNVDKAKKLLDDLYFRLERKETEE
ncbi:MAG: hypothetical protein WCS33_02310 [Candidatus Caldatribacteriota bacterium]